MRIQIHTCAPSHVFGIPSTIAITSTAVRFQEPTPCPPTTQEVVFWYGSADPAISPCSCESSPMQSLLVNRIMCVGVATFRLPKKLE